MSTLQKIVTLDITPEQFINNCSPVELQEIILLACYKIFQIKAPATTREAPLIRTRPDPDLSSPPPPLSPPSFELPEPSGAPIKERPAATGAPAPRQLSQRWSPKEDEIIRKRWRTTTGVQLAQELNRDYKSLMAHAAALGLKKNAKPATPIKAQRHTDCIGAEITHP
jgi:hypothetical protein